MITSLYNKKHEDLKAAEKKRKKNINVHLETFHFFECNLTKQLRSEWRNIRLAPYLPERNYCESRQVSVVYFVAENHASIC